jgi:hypothetical protein
MNRIKLGMIAAMAALAALTVSAPVHAGGNHGHHGGGHYDYRYSNHRYDRYRHNNRHYRHYGHNRHNHKYGYLAAGLVLGAVINNHAYSRPRVERRTVVYRTPVQTRQTVYTPSVQVEPQAVPAPIERPDYYLRKDRNGECWLVENTEDGEQIITPQSPDVCG